MQLRRQDVRKNNVRIVRSLADSSGSKVKLTNQIVDKRDGVLELEA